MAKQIDSTNLGYLLGKIKAAFWRKSETSELTIDNTPTANSDNLVKSGGVYSAVNGKLSKDGGVMSANAEIDIYDTGDPEDYEASTNIYAGGVDVGGEYGSTSISGCDIAMNGSNGGHVELYASSNDSNLIIQPGFNTDNMLILRHDGFTHGVGSTEKTWSFPSQSGTLALTSDIPSTSNFVPKSGGTMNSGATITVPNTSAGSTTTIGPGYVDIEKGDFFIQIDTTTLTPRITVQDEDSSTLVRLQPTELIYGDGTDTYTQSFPSKSGTFAMTSDIPTVNNSTITIQKGGSNVDSFTTNASSNKSINIPNELPSYSSSNNGQILSVVNGSLAWVTPAQIYNGSGTPSNSTGNNGDIYVQS